MNTHRGRYKSILTLVFALVFLLMANFFYQKAQRPLLNISMQQAALNFKSNYLQLFTFGQKRLISSILWIHTLMESDLEHYKQKDLNSWMYLRFQTITSLDPQFYEAYLYGGQYLSIVKNDLLGAKKIYEKGLKLFPDNYKLTFNAAFNYTFELKDMKSGHDIWDRINDLPKAPRFIP